MSVLLVTTQAQTIQPGGSVAFQRLANGCCNKKREGVCVSDIDNTPKFCDTGEYLVSLKANVSSATSVPVQLALALDGSQIPYTTIAVTPAPNVNDTISEMVPMRIKCCARGRLTVVNNGTNPITVNANTFLSVTKNCC